MLALLRKPCTWVVIALLVGASFLALHAAESTEDAERADARADSLAQVVRAATGRTDSLAAVSDSLEGALDSVERRERTFRDSIGRLLAREDEEIEVAAQGASEADSVEALAHAELLERVRPDLRPVVRRAIRADSAEDSNRDRLQEAQAAKIRLLAQDTTSLTRENRQLRETLQGVQVERDTLRSALADAREALDRMEEARDRWRQVAKRPWWGVLLGDGVVETAGTLGSGTAAVLLGKEEAVGWGLAKAGDFVAWAITRNR